MAYDKITIPSEGNKIIMKNGILEVPNNPIPIATVIREKVGDLKFVSELM